MKQDMKYTMLLDETDSKIDKCFQINFYRFLHNCIHSTYLSFSVSKFNKNILKYVLNIKQ